METFILALEITDVSLFCNVVKTHKNMQSLNISKEKYCENNCTLR